MKKKVIAFGACAVVATAVAMPVTMNATQLGLEQTKTQVTKTQKEGQAYDMKVRVTNAKGNPIEGAQVVVKEIGGSNANTLTTNAEGLVDLQLPGYMQAEISVSVPSQGERVVKETITYDANTTPDKELTIAWTAEGPKEEKPLSMKIAVQRGTGEEPIAGLDVKVECENRESQTLKTDETGVLNLDLPGYGTYKLTSEAPEGYVNGIDATIEYSEANTPKTDMVIKLQKEGDEPLKSTREVIIKHVDANTGEVIKGGKAQIIDATTNNVVVENVDLSNGEMSIGELERGELYKIQWLEDAEGYKGSKEVQEFVVLDDDGAQTVEFSSVKEGEQAPAVKTKLTLGLEDKVSKEPIKSGKLTLTASTGDKQSFDVDFSKPETLTLDVMSNDKYSFEFTQLPEGYILPADASNEFTISPDDKGNQTYTIQLMKESASGNLGGGTTTGGALPQTGTVATGIGLAGLTTVGAFFGRRKFRK